MDERSVQHIRKANDAGPIVYVFMEDLSWIGWRSIRSSTENACLWLNALLG